MGYTRHLYDKIWYKGIRAGEYTTADFMELTEYKFKRNYIYANLRRLGVEQIVPENRIKNETVWLWKGANYYIQRRIEENVV